MSPKTVFPSERFSLNVLEKSPAYDLLFCKRVEVSDNALFPEFAAVFTSSNVFTVSLIKEDIVQYFSSLLQDYYPS